MPSILRHCYKLRPQFHKSQIIHLKSLEVVYRGNETQLQVTENFNRIAHCSSFQHD